MGLLGPDGVHALDGEGRVVHLEGEGGGLQESVLEGDGDVGADADVEGALRLRCRAGAVQREDVLAAKRRGQGEQAAHLAQLAWLEVDLRGDFNARLATRQGIDELLNRKVRKVSLRKKYRNDTFLFLTHIRTQRKPGHQKS